ncbi:MAG: molecular chaperone DnaJ [Gammaproteobacteria bacterium]|jgi:uncharacterized membrane protein
MELSGSFFNAAWLVGFGATLAFALWQALRWAQWQWLAEERRMHVFFGAVVSLMLLWSLRTEVQPGFAWHLSGMVSVTLMFGWSLAVIAGCLSLAGVVVAGLSDWAGFAPSAVLLVLLPATLTQAVLGIVRAYLPKHYFIYVFVNAFFAAGLIAVVGALVTTAVLLAVGASTLDKLRETYLLFLPLMFFPEAVLNGWIMSLMVGFKPAWVRSFRDDEYLDGK